MRISQKCRFGLSILIYLALENINNYMTFEEIRSKNPRVNEKEVKKQLVVLRDAGYVDINKAKNQYSLLKDPKDIYIIDVLKSLEEDLNLIEIPEIAEVGTLKYTLQKHVWNPTNLIIEETLKDITLQALVEKQSLLKTMDDYSI